MCRGRGSAQPARRGPTSPRRGLPHTPWLCASSPWWARSTELVDCTLIGQLRLGQLGPKGLQHLCRLLDQEGEALDGLGGGDRSLRSPRTAPSWAWKPSCSPALRRSPASAPAPAQTWALHLPGAMPRAQLSFSLSPGLLSPRKPLPAGLGLLLQMPRPTGDHRLAAQGESSGNGTRSLEQAEAARCWRPGAIGVGGTHRAMAEPPGVAVGQRPRPGPPSAGLVDVAV